MEDPQGSHAILRLRRRIGTNRRQNDWSDDRNNNNDNRRWRRRRPQQQQQQQQQQEQKQEQETKEVTCFLKRYGTEKLLLGTYTSSIFKRKWRLSKPVFL